MLWTKTIWVAMPSVDQGLRWGSRSSRSQHLSKRAAAREPRPSNGEDERQGGIVIGHNYRIPSSVIGQKMEWCSKPRPKRKAGLTSHWPALRKSWTAHSRDGWLLTLDNRLDTYCIRLARQASTSRDSASRPGGTGSVRIHRIPTLSS